MLIVSFSITSLQILLKLIIFFVGIGESFNLEAFSFYEMQYSSEVRKELGSEYPTYNRRKRRQIFFSKYKRVNGRFQLRRKRVKTNGSSRQKKQWKKLNLLLWMKTDKYFNFFCEPLAPEKFNDGNFFTSILLIKPY